MLKIISLLTKRLRKMNNENIGNDNANLVKEGKMMPGFNPSMQDGILNTAANDKGPEGPVTDKQPEPQPPKVSYRENMSDEEVVQYCETNLKDKTADEIEDLNDLDALSRWGKIMAARRNAVEHTGREARLKIVKGQIEKIEKRYAVASIIADLAPQNLTKAITGQQPAIPFEVVIKVAGEEIAISYDSINADYAPGQQQLGVFQKAVSDIARVVTGGCQRQYQVVNAGTGETFGLPFDFQTPKAEILAKVSQ